MPAALDEQGAGVPDVDLPVEVHLTTTGSIALATMRRCSLVGTSIRSLSARGKGS